MESKVPYIEIVPLRDEEEDATYDTGNKGNISIQFITCKFVI